MKYFLFLVRLLLILIMNILNKSGFRVFLDFKKILCVASKKSSRFISTRLFRYSITIIALIVLRSSISL